MSSGDGRGIDPTLGRLEGEAADQQAPAVREGTQGAAPFEVWARPPSASAAELPGEPTYYGRPVLKESVWEWYIPAYFFVGGVAGASAVLGASAQLLGGEALRPLVRRCRWLGSSGVSAGTFFLIKDLGRPNRFINMLRVFRPTSPLNVGSWLLVAFGPSIGGAAVLAGVDGALGTLGDAAGIAAGVIGVPLSGYTGVLLAGTAVPAWEQARRSLPALFIASAASAAAGLLELVCVRPDDQAVVRRFGLAGGVAELVAARAMEKELARAPEVGRPYREGVSGTTWRVTKVLAATSVILSISARGSRRRHVVGAVLATAASIGVKVAVFHAGKASARDHRSTFRAQRAGLGGTEVTGRPAVTGAP